MNIITQLVILTLSLLLVNAIQVQYCTNLYKNFKHNCTPSMITIKNCCELKELNTLKPNYTSSGVYKMRKGTFNSPADVYCDMTTDGGGWTVIQRNKKASTVDFNKNWTDYEEGFGDLKTEFWYGLDAIHCFTETGQWEMRIDYQNNDKTWSYLRYNQFSVGSASEEYPVTTGGFKGIGTDWFARKNSPQNGMKFSTPDNDNDGGSGNCAVSYKSGWWYNNCYYINPNTQPPTTDNGRSVSFMEMKIRPKDCNIH